MNLGTVYSSQFVEITRKEDGFYIQSFRPGMSMEQLNRLMGEHPEIRITSFMAIKSALVSAPKPPAKFGEVKERINAEISSDELKAYITLSVVEVEFTGERKINLIKEVVKKLNENSIVYGVKQSVLLNELCNNRPILVAEGLQPVNGQDSVIRMYQISDVKPEAKEDGKVDHYELSLINRVNEGDWLGERTDPTPGIPGKSVKGNAILPMPGKKYPVSYERNSVREVYENGVTTLYSMRTGAVHYEGDRIGVSNHLEIGGNIDFKTGNIDFDGFLTVKGTIEDNFSVSANEDIEVLGEYGIGSVREINSRSGSIFIRGGIAGKNKAVIKSKKNIYTKYISDATIMCEGSVHIGFYCLNSNIKAREVILDSPKGQIIGGSIQAEIKVVSSIIGSASEKRTYITVSGFERKNLKDTLEKLILQIEELKNKIARAKQEVSIYTNTADLTREQRVAFERIKDKYFELRDELKHLEDERKAYVNYLKAKGEGEISILKRAYPNSVLEIKRIVKEVDKMRLAASFYIQDGEIKEI